MFDLQTIKERNIEAYDPWDRELIDEIEKELGDEEGGG